MQLLLVHVPSVVVTLTRLDGVGEGRGIRMRPARTWHPVQRGFHLDKVLFQQQNTKKQPGTKNNHVQEPLGQITDNKVQREGRNPAVASEEPGAKAGGRKPKQGAVREPPTQHHQRGGRPDLWTRPYPHPT